MQQPGVAWEGPDAEVAAFSKRHPEIQIVSLSMGAGAMTYAVGGKQYIAIVVGHSVTIPSVMDATGKAILSATPEGGALMVFSL